MKTEKIVLTVLCVGACIWCIKMLVGVIGLSRHQDVSTAAAVFELAMFFGAGSLPLIAIWLIGDRKRKWLYLLWTPCILHAVFLAISYSRVSPSGGFVRLFLWFAIVVLFIRESKKIKVV